MDYRHRCRGKHGGVSDTASEDEPQPDLKWRKNGYKNVKGTAVANADLFMEIDEQFGSLGELGTTVSFWHVPRKHNREADLLANKALNEELLGRLMLAE